jgi:Zinc finger, C2H2 type
MGTTGYKSSSSNPKQYRCSMCGRIFSNAEELSSHQRMEHSQSSQPPAGVS